MRYSDAELALINATFAENDTLLKRMRKVFLQMTLTEEDKKILSVLNKPELLAIIKKTFMPEVDVEAPIGQNIDLLMLSKTEGKDPIEAQRELDGRIRFQKVINKGIERLQTLSTYGTEDIVDYSPSLNRLTAEEDIIQLNVRNSVLTHTEQMLLQLKLLAGIKKETLEETKSRLAKDSTK